MMQTRLLPAELAGWLEDLRAGHAALERLDGELAASALAYAEGRVQALLEGLRARDTVLPPLAFPSDLFRDLFEAGEETFADLFRFSIARERSRPALLLLNGDVDLDGEDVDPLMLERLDAARREWSGPIRAVGRIELDRDIGSASRVGTGWRVRDSVIITNRHVADVFAKAGGEGFVFKQRGFGLPGAHTASIDYLGEYGVPETDISDIIGIRHIDQARDVALLDLAAPGAGRIDLADFNPSVGDQIVAIGYPGSSTEQPKELLDLIFGGAYGYKRASPGMVTKPPTREGIFEHDCSVLRGNSGSVILDLETRKAVGLHFSGRRVSESFSNFAIAAPTLAGILEKAKL